MVVSSLQILFSGGVSSSFFVTVPVYSHFPFLSFNFDFSNFSSSGPLDVKATLGVSGAETESVLARGDEKEDSELSKAGESCIIGTSQALSLLLQVEKAHFWPFSHVSGRRATIHLLLGCCWT